MKETKVYVDELPKCCRKCVFCYDNRPYWKSTDCFLNHKELDEDEIETSRDKDCPLIDIKTHNRELVKEVLEKVKNEAYKDGFYDEDGNKIITYHINNYILDQLQKEFEK